MEKRFLKFLILPLFLLTLFSCGGLEPGMSVLLGNYNYQIGEFQQATVSYVKGLETGRYNQWIYYNMGNVYFSLGESGAAMDVWSHAESAEDPDLRYRLNFNQGVLQYQLGRYEEAYVLFKESLKADPASIDAKINLELTLGKLAAPVTENGGTSGGSSGTVNPAETERLLEYIKRREGELWFSTQKEEETYREDW